MENEKRIIELLAEMLLKSDRMDEKYTKMLDWQSQTVEELRKLNLLSGESTRAIFKLADKIELLAGQG